MNAVILLTDSRLRLNKLTVSNKLMARLLLQVQLTNLNVHTYIMNFDALDSPIPLCLLKVRVFRQTSNIFIAFQNGSLML